MWYQIAETACIFSTPRPAYVPAKAIKRGDLTRHKLCGAKCCFNDWDRSSRRHHHRRQLFLKNWTDNAISDNNSSLPLHYKQFCRWILFCSKTSPRELFFHSILHRWNILKVGFSYLECFRQLTLFCDGRGFKKDYSSVEPNVSKENYKRCKIRKVKKSSRGSEISITQSCF